MPKLFFALLFSAAFLQQPSIQAQSTASYPISPSSSPAAAPTILESYIRTGLDSNLALHQRNFDWQRAQLDLKRAKSLFYPEATFSSQYTAANGGRSQSIPVGDLLNGVYSSLNQLTGTNKFPQVANQNIQFLPNDYHDTKMEISLPLFNMDLQHNKQVNGEMINARRADADIYKRDLVQHIRQAYYQFLQAGKAVEIYTNALGLVKENRRVSEKFVANRMATKEIVLRAQAQVSQVESSLIEARNNLRNAAAYFNFLLNRPLETPVLADPALTAEPAGPTSSAAAPTDPALTGTSSTAVASTVPPPTGAFPAGPPAGIAELPAGREELNKVNSMQKILESNLKWNKSYLFPKLSAFYDIGYQGFGFRFNSAQFYQLAGVQLTWPLFRAGDNKYKIRQAQIDIASVGDQYRELTQQLTLQVQTVSNDYSSAIETLQSLSDEVSSARETYRLAERRFNEGQALQIELIDARTQMTGAELRYSLGRLTVLNRAADLERATASYKF
ncbi:MAG TPA: TolC family protein [Puia sp.]|jgi:outer membrane protein TolC|nr:TolC family protein [Puia sp.]